MMPDLPENINICSDPILKKCLVEIGINARVFDTILSGHEKTKMLELLEQFSSNWFLTKDDVDYTEYKNISIGAATHDEVRTLFHMLLHFIFILDKLGTKNKITFYHSPSCIMPDIIIKLLVQSNVKIKFVQEKYSWLSFKEHLDSQARANFSRISFWQYEKYSRIQSKLGQIKLTLKQILSRVFSKLSKKRERNIYLHAQRSLMHFYNSYLNKEKNSFGIYITDTTPMHPKPDRKRMNIFKEIQQLFYLARKGVILDSLRCPFYYRWYVNYKKGTNYKELTNNFYKFFPEKATACLNIKNKIFSEYFEQVFKEFYLGHLIQFMKLIDFYYEKFTRINIDLCLQEMCHPFQAQILANIGIPCRIYPSNHIIHNQYFAPTFFKKVKHLIKPIAISHLDSARFDGLGFDKNNIQTVNPNFLEPLSGKVMPFHKINSLKKKKILILGPAIICMDTFRYQMQSEALYNFFSDIFEVLSELSVSSVTIRPHPGEDEPRNQFGYTGNDILQSMINKVEANKKLFDIKFSNSLFQNIERDILEHDIAIGHKTGALFEVLIFGRDFIYFDNMITPYYGTKDWSLFNEGTIKKLETKEELRNYLVNYKPPDLELLREKLLGNILTQKNSNGTTDPFTLL